MRKFLYLRILAIITLACTTSITVYLTYLWVRNIKWDVWFFVIELIMVQLVGHSASVLYIYHRCYPDKELSRATDLFYQITSYGCGTVCFIFLIFAIVMASVEMDRQRASSTAILVIALILAAFAVQLYGGKRLFRAIQQNVRKQLENSFA